MGELVDCASWSHWDIWEAREPSSSLEEGTQIFGLFIAVLSRKEKVLLISKTMIKNGMHF